MIYIYIICFVLLVIGAVLLLGVTPDSVATDIMKLISPHETLREKVLKAKGKKKSHKLTAELNRIRYALESTGREKSFALACAASLILLVVGCIVAIAIGNVFLIPVTAIALAAIPFAYLKSTINYYENHIKEELETALSIITTSYLRNDDIVLAIRENVEYLKPPMKEIFATFVTENTMITSDIRQSLRHLKDKIDNLVFREWCDVAIACQDDRTLKDTLMPIVGKLTDIRLANSEIKGVLTAARTEYFVMAGMVVANIPMLYILNRDWYSALMDTTFGKLVLGICGITILITCILMFRYTKPVEYKGGSV